MKYNSRNNLNKNIFFWRTKTQKEIDFIEEFDGMIKWYEFKFNSDTYKKHKDFLDSYDNSSIDLVNKKNYLEFIL